MELFKGATIAHYLPYKVTTITIPLGIISLGAEISIGINKKDLITDLPATEVVELKSGATITSWKTPEYILEILISKLEPSENYPVDVRYGVVFRFKPLVPTCHDIKFFCRWAYCKGECKNSASGQHLNANVWSDGLSLAHIGTHDYNNIIEDYFCSVPINWIFTPNDEPRVYSGRVTKKNIILNEFFECHFAIAHTFDITEEGEFNSWNTVRSGPGEVLFNAGLPIEIEKEIKLPLVIFRGEKIVFCGKISDLEEFIQEKNIDLSQCDGYEAQGHLLKFDFIEKSDLLKKSTHEHYWWQFNTPILGGEKYVQVTCMDEKPQHAEELEKKLRKFLMNRRYILRDFKVKKNYSISWLLKYVEIYYNLVIFRFQRKFVKYLRKLLNLFKCIK